MAPQPLHDLFHDSVRDTVAPDLSDAAWRSAVRTRRRRTTALVAGAAAAVVGVVGAVSTLGNGSSSPLPPVSTRPPSTSPRPSPSVPLASGPAVQHGTTPDATYRGTPVYWGPTVSQEPLLPQATSVLPSRIDLSGPGPERHLPYALAAFAVLRAGDLDRLVVVARDGSTSLVDVSRVQPLVDADGNAAGPYQPTMLSPTGRYLLFPQQHDLLVYTLATGRWRHLDPLGQTTEFARWANDTQIYLPPRFDGGYSHLVDVNGMGAGAENDPAPRGPLTGGASPYGRLRTGVYGVAQSWFGDADLPVPPGGISPPQVLVVDRGRHDAVLEFTDIDGQERTKGCCTVQFWLDEHSVAYESADSDTVVAWRVGTHDFSKVTTIDGFDRAQESVIGSYTRIWTTYGRQ